MLSKTVFRICTYSPLHYVSQTWLTRRDMINDGTNDVKYLCKDLTERSRIIECRGLSRAELLLELLPLLHGHYPLLSFFAGLFTSYHYQYILRHHLPLHLLLIKFRNIFCIAKLWYKVVSQRVASKGDQQAKLEECSTISVTEGIQLTVLDKFNDKYCCPFSTCSPFVSGCYLCGWRVVSN